MTKSTHFYVFSVVLLGCPARIEVYGFILESRDEMITGFMINRGKFETVLLIDVKKRV